MTILFPRLVQKTDEQNTDQFGKVQVANPFTQIEFKLTRGLNPLQITSKLVGTATLTHEPTNSNALATVTTSGDSVIVQTLGKANYQPGKSLEAMITGCPDPNGTHAASSCVSRAGLYDDDGGVFFEYDGTDFYCVIRKGGVDTKIASASWNGDLDYSPDPTKVHIFGFTCSWLGVSSVDFWLFHNGDKVLVHRQNHDNIITSAYTRDMNKPLRYQLISAGGASSLRIGCGVASSIGGYFPSSLQFSTSRGLTPQTLSTGQTEPLVALRYKSTGSLQNARIDLRSISVITIDNTPFLYRVWFCPPGSGTLTTPTWVSVDAESALEYDISSTSFTSTGCTVIQQGYSSSGNDTNSILKNEIKLGVDVDGVSGLYVLEVSNVTGQNQDYYGGITFSEYF